MDNMSSNETQGNNFDLPGLASSSLATPRSPLATGHKRLHSAESPHGLKYPRTDTESSPTDEGAVTSDRQRVLQLICDSLWELRRKHDRNLAELFFLQNSNNYLDFETWLNSSPPQLVAYLQANSFEISNFPGARPASTPISSDSGWKPPPERPVEQLGNVPSAIELVSTVYPGNTPVQENAGSKLQKDLGAMTVSLVPRPSTLPPHSASSSLLESAASLHGTSPTILPVITSSSSSVLGFATTAATPFSSRSVLDSQVVLKQSPGAIRQLGIQVPAHRGPGRPPGKKNAGNIVNGTRYRAAFADGRIEHAAKQEATVLRRIAELRRDGLWSSDKLPKCADPPRGKTHWDFLLEEMKWMAMDFEQERKWKKAAARKLAAKVVSHKREQEDKHKRAELDREKELKRVASFAAKEIRQFWNGVEKVVEYKAESILEAKRKRALDKHLDFIVGQTEKFSSLVQEDLARSTLSSRPESEVGQDEGGDSDFEASESSEDDESTLDKEEEQTQAADVDEEVALLQRECDMELDDILQSLPADYLAMEGDSEAGPSTSGKTIPDDGNESVTSEESGREAEEDSAALPEDVDFAKLRSDNSDVRQQELTHFAETAEKLQPKGFTLESAKVVTKVPFLLKHQLREYQHVGLDWLVTLYERKLNGILADEMGLGKTIQTIALLAHLACEKGIWGPHLIIVPTTVMLNWEMELKKWCPGFKILTYYGSIKERKEKRHGWSKPNAFHVCITSYKLVLQDHLVFRRKKWEYIVLDEAQNIKNFKSQRWQMLLHFNAQRRLLLTGTPLQNSLMELWSLMHFLMPDIFASHKDFKDWFSNPVTDMIEGNRDFNEQTIKRLHKVLRPFILRRLKAEVEKQLPKKYEHVVSCALSKRQRFLYDDFMSRASTKDQLHTGRVMSVLSVLIQLRKVCNHPNLFESRPITSPFVMERLALEMPCLVLRQTTKDEAQVPPFLLLQRCPRDACARCRQLAPDRRLIEELRDEDKSDQPKLPVVSGFKFTPLKPSLAVSSSSRTADATSRKKNFQFVIPPQAAEQLNFHQPFLVQVQTASGPRLVPIQLRPPANDALTKIGLNVQGSLSLPASAGADSQTQLPVWRLSQPSAFGAATLQPPLSGIGTRAATSRLAVVNRGTGIMGQRPGISVTLMRPPGSQVATGLDATDSPIRTRTVLFRPAVSRRGAPSDVVRPQITVQELRSSTPPVVRYVVPASATVSSLPNSKPSTPIPSPSATPVSPSQFANATSCLPSPLESAGSEADSIEKTSESSPQSAESAAAAVPGVTVKRSASASSGLEPVAKRRSIERRHHVLQFMATINEQRNLFEPLFGSELERVLALGNVDFILPMRRTVMELKEELVPLLTRFCIYTPAVMSGLPRSPFLQDSLSSELEVRWPEINGPFKSIIDSQMVQFPEVRLIEYDCGKLQTLTRLLRSLKDEGHRCLIFTQMTKMLDILEAFLSYLGFKYLRLDGATPIENRQVVMERFNQDSRIFCLILSTRSGGLGVNLTGADTVIFYDSDWNPTMDAQAQDRCHRIGQTRDVHIYRLISEKTVEENILKKAEQKRRLGEVAIEEGSFTTEFFKKKNLKDIFDLSDDVTIRVDETGLSQQDLEQQMSNLEDENDARAARCARAEVTAELSEFDENQAGGGDDDADPDVLEVEQKMKQLMTELKPIERYAVKYLELVNEPYHLEELQQTEEQIEKRKQQWELANRERLQQKEVQRKRDEEEEFELSYAYEDSLAQMFCPSEPLETMAVWMPPTPPMSDTEFEPYIDHTMGYLYNLDPMEEGDLPPVAGELDLFRSPSKPKSSAQLQSLSSAGTSAASDIPAAVAETVANIRNSFNKTPKESQPKSLFEAGSAYRPKRDVRKPMTPPSPGFTEQEAADFPEWTVLEDYALLTAVTSGQQMVYSLASAHAGHVPNWDYVSKWVSSVVGHYCSARACCNRYQLVVLPREEGRLITIDPVTKKPRKVALTQQELSNVKKSRMRTGQQFQQEGSQVMASKVNQRFAAIRQTLAKRMKIQRERGLGLANCLPATLSARRRQEMHLQQTFGVNPENVLGPVQLADMREERLKELKKQHLLQQQQASAFHSQHQQMPQGQMPYQPQQQQPMQQQMQPLQSLPQYSQAVPQSQGLTEPQTPLAYRGATPVSATYGITSMPGSLHQHQQSQLDGSQVSVAVHPASRLVSGSQHIRQSAVVASGQPGPGSTSMIHGIPSNSPRSQGMVGMGARSSMSAPTTATVYRQVGASGGLIRAQRTPPSTPAPSGLHIGASVQASSGTPLQRTPSLTPVTVSLSASASDSTPAPVITPVVVQAPPATVRFQAVSSSGARQKIQFGTGGFLVSADVSKPTVLSMPPVQMSSQGAGTSHQAITPMARGTSVTPRQQMQLSQTGLAASGKKNIALPRIAAAFASHSAASRASPVHLVAPVTSKIAAAQSVHGIRQVPSPSPLIRAQPTAISGGRNIPSISMIMPPVGRVETIPGSGVSVTGTVQSQHSGVSTTSASVVSPQGTPGPSQTFGAPTTRE